MYYRNFGAGVRKICPALATQLEMKSGLDLANFSDSATIIMSCEGRKSL